MLLCKLVKRRKGKRRGGSVTIIGSGGRFDALVVLDQALVRELEFEQQDGCPGLVVVEELPLAEPLAPVGALRKPAEEGAGGRVESRDARCASGPALPGRD